MYYYETFKGTNRTDLPPNPVIVRVKETCSVPARSEICLLLKTEGNVDGLPGMVEQICSIKTVNPFCTLLEF